MSIKAYGFGFRVVKFSQITPKFLVKLGILRADKWCHFWSNINKLFIKTYTLIIKYICVECNWRKRKIFVMDLVIKLWHPFYSDPYFTYVFFVLINVFLFDLVFTSLFHVFTSSSLLDWDQRNLRNSFLINPLSDGNLFFVSG